MWLLLVSLFTIVAQPQPSPEKFALTVQGGTGSGLYRCREVVTVKAPRKLKTTGSNNDGQTFTSEIEFDTWFSDWTGDVTIENKRKTKAQVKMPCRAAQVTPMYTGGKPPKR